MCTLYYHLYTVYFIYLFQELVIDKDKGVDRPRLLIYDIMQFEGNKDVSKCDHQRRLLCVEKELIQPREEAVSIKTKLSVYSCIYPSTLSIYPSIHSSIFLLIHPSILPSVH